MKGKKKKRRWYDAQPELGELIESLKIIEKKKAKKLFKGIKNIITTEDPDLINRTVLQYPLGVERRWYDKDPLSWMTVNALQYADTVIRSKVIDYLKHEYEKIPVIKM